MGLFDWLSDQTDQKNNFQPTNFGQTQNYNANAFNYGGSAGAAEQHAQNYGLMGRQAQGREGVGLNTMQSDQSRAGMGQAAGLMMARANGTTPSISGMQAQQDMGRAVAAQASAANSARGPAAMALAQQNAAANTANAQSAISGQAQINAANERMQAEQGAMGAYGAMRGMDQQQAMQQAQLQDAQRSRNDAFQMGMTQNEMAVRNAQMQGQMAQQGLLAGSHMQGQQLGAGIAGQNAQTNGQMLNTTLGLGVGAISMASDARAKVGAVPLGGGMLSDVTSKIGLAQLGGPAQINQPMSGAAPATFDKLAPGGGMDVMGSLKAHSNFATQFQRNPTGGMMQHGGLMLSDDRAKLRDHERQAYLLGRAHGMEKNQDFAYGGAPREGEEIVDRDPWRSTERMAEQRPDWLEGYMNEGRAGSERAGLAMGLSPYEERGGSSMRRGVDAHEAPPSFQSKAGDYYAAQPAMSEMTGQLARGLAPYAYEYKPGFGTPGQKVGPMAQSMAANDVTATAVRQDPQSGLLAIDRDDGLKVALGGVGHLASKQAEQERLIAALLADRERPNRRY
jgi:hypothetical protein